MSFRIAVFISACIMCLSITAISQQAGQDPLGCDTKEGRQLSFLVGKWNVRSKARIGGQADKWEESEGTSRIKFLFENCLLQEKLEVKRDGRPLTIAALYSYNNFTNNYQWVFAHSEHGLLAFYEGPQKDGVFTFKQSIAVRGRIVMFERILKRTKTGFSLNAKRSFDGGKTWRFDWYLTYYR